ncbi:MAG TPA: tryptophan--tRNA ligase [candidate division WOR-3 bacterium]|uniref:Tryptophan--tRNA ligase n=1 Tax=candidate division WOR-3 bacterium TaxID=2052148 RepID=A0A7C0ZEA6_UNCW3|nr:tryptophan--tRNA ligase [candidate division WOR-3 bacterium]
MERVLSGLRPTGRIHIGNYFGALVNWVRFQDEYKCFYEVADWHALTTMYPESKKFRGLIRETVLDWLTVGIDPEKSVLFVQSDVKEHAELHLLFSMLVTIPRLQRNPTIKEVVKDLHMEDKISYGLLGYPVLQASDVLIYRPQKVPIGEDQLPHLELTREIARRFNHLYGETFPEPEPILTKTKRIPGIDGRKMSKSYGNAIYITEPPEEVEKKIMQAFTDPEKIKKDDPGHPEGCVVFAYRSTIDEDGTKELEKKCRAGEIGCVQCKRETAKMMNEFLDKFRKRREELKSVDVTSILKEGAEKAREFARETMQIVRERMGMWSRD